MKKSFPASLVTVQSFTVRSRLKAHGCIATQNRWQATQMRQQVMDYYNDQIMENLIRTKEKLAFVRVDVTSLTTTDAASLTGTIGGGETTGFTRNSPSSSLVGALHTITRTVSRPFSYSVAPARNTSLQILASPALGTLPAESQTTSKTTKKTETTMPAPPEPPTKPDKTKESVKTTTIEEETLKSKPRTVYDLYDGFLCNYRNALVSNGSTPPKAGYVPGTIKHWRTKWADEY